MLISIPGGLIYAFAGLLKQETPRKYSIIGLILNLLWLLAYIGLVLVP